VRCRRFGIASGLALITGVIGGCAQPTLVSQAPGPSGTEVDGDTPSISADGGAVAFVSSTLGRGKRGQREASPRVFVRDFESGKTTLVSRAGGAGGSAMDGRSPSISASGRYVAYVSSSRRRIFVRDRRRHETVLVSRADGARGAPANAPCAFPAVSPDGRFVAFYSRATNLGPGGRGGAIFIRDLRRDRTTVASRGTEPARERPSLSNRAHVIAFAARINNGATQQILVRDLASGDTAIASRHGKAGAKGNAPASGPALTPDGHYVAFVSKARNLVAPRPESHGYNVYVRYLRRRETVLASPANASIAGAGSDAAPPSISSDARYVAYLGKDPDGGPIPKPFVRDLSSDSTQRISEPEVSGGTGRARHIVMSADGRYVAFRFVSGRRHPHGGIYRAVIEASP
jgi:Tol biopolymer transport system component